MIDLEKLKQVFPFINELNADEVFGFSGAYKCIKAKCGRYFFEARFA